MITDVASLEGRIVAGRYRVVGRLGVGGMGSVWLVQHTESLQRLALKTLHLRASLDRNMVERFLREARAAASLKSRNVVKVVDAQTTYVDPETAYPCPFIVMELLEGCNLEQRMRSNGPMTPAEVLWVFQQAARALDLAHGKGIVHRDLKPENLFLHNEDGTDRDPILKVCDFGIAKLSGGAAMGLMDTGAMGTDAQQLFGTPLYMSPEQARSSKTVSPTTDQWAMALIAFRLLTNTEYFAGADTPADLLMKIISDAMIRPSMRTPLFPPALDAWFLKSVERDPNGRWPSVGAQAQALAEALDGVTATPPKFEVRALPQSEPPPSTKREKGLRSGAGQRSDPMLESAKTAAAPQSAQPSSFRSGSNPTLEPTPSQDRFRMTVEPSSATNRTAQELANATRRVGVAPSRWKLAAAAVAVMFILFGSYMLGRRGGPESTATTPSTEHTGAPGAPTGSGATTATVTATVSANVTATATVSASATTTTTATASATASVAPSATTTTVAVVPKPKPSVTAAASASATAVVTPSTKKAAGAPCERSSECASGLCTAFTCR